VDRLIDDVARGMTDVNPPLDLRAAVLERLDRRPAWRLLWLAAPVTVAAALVLAIGLRDEVVTVNPPPAISPVVQTVSKPLVDPPAAGVGEPVRKATRPRPPAVALSPIRSLAALSGPRALGARDIQPDVLAIPLLDMKPIVTEPIAIRTIDDGSGRHFE
jgi:hypothetical protein